MEPYLAGLEVTKRGHARALVRTVSSDYMDHICVYLVAVSKWQHKTRSQVTVVVKMRDEFGTSGSESQQV